LRKKWKRNFTSLWGKSKKKKNRGEIKEGGRGGEKRGKAAKQSSIADSYNNNMG